MMPSNLQLNADRSVIPQLWIPVAVIAHLFAAIWLIRALQLFQRALWARITSLLGLRRPAVTNDVQPGTKTTSQTWAATVNVEHHSDDRTASASGLRRDPSGISYPLVHYGSLKRSATQQDITSAQVNGSSSSNSSDWEYGASAVVNIIDSAHQQLPAEVSNPLSGQPQHYHVVAKSHQSEHLRLSWEGISCSYRTSTANKSVLKDVWGEAASGEIQALIGPSGAGKSHLLDILAHRKNTGSITGRILLNGDKVDSKAYRRRVAYVPQDDNFIPALTTAECLSFYSALLLPAGSHKRDTAQGRSLTEIATPAASAVAAADSATSALTVQMTALAREQRSEPSLQDAALQTAGCSERSIQELLAKRDRKGSVDYVLNVVGLSQHRSTMVGGRLPGGLLLRGLSSGERRRLSIAVGILANPDILFLDEPTSGLDSSAALSVMRYLQGLAHGGGKAVVAAVHQPRSAIWGLFDKVTLLASGLLVYHGPTSNMVPWLSGVLGFKYDPAIHGLASDWALDLVSLEFSRSQTYPSWSMTTMTELQLAAEAFKQQYLAHKEQSAQQPDNVYDTHQVEVESVLLPAGWRAASQNHSGSVTPSVIAYDQPASSSTSDITRGTRHIHQQHHSFDSCPGHLSRAASSHDGPRTDSSSSSVASYSSYSSTSSDHTDAEAAAACSASSSGSVRNAARVLQTLKATHHGVGHAHHMGQTAAGSNFLTVVQIPAALGTVQTTPSSSSGLTYPADPLHVQVTAANESQIVPVQAADPQISTTTASSGCYPCSGRFSSSSCYPTSWWQQYKALAWREFLKMTRNPSDVAGRTLTFTWVALLVGLIYYDLPTDASSIRQRLNLLFATLCFFLLMPFINMSMYTDDKGIYLADRAARLYRPAAYYVAKASAVLPFNVFSSLCYSLIQYGMTGMRPGPSNIFKHGAIGTLTSLIAVQVLHLAATITPNQDAAFMMGIGWTCTNMVMSGFFIPYREIRFSALSNLRYTSALHYAFEGLLGVEFKGRRFQCPPAGLDAVSADFFTQLLPGAASLATPALMQRMTNGSAGGCVVDSGAVARYFGLGKSFGATISVLAGYLGILHIVTFVALLVVARKEGR